MYINAQNFIVLLNYSFYCLLRFTRLLPGTPRLVQ